MFGTGHPICGPQDAAIGRKALGRATLQGIHVHPCLILRMLPKHRLEPTEVGPQIQ